MSAMIRKTFVLQNALKGKTIKLGKFPFVGGKIAINATPVEMELYQRTLWNNWNAVPEEVANEQRDLSSASESNRQREVRRGGEPEGQGAEAGDGAEDGAGAAEADAGATAELAEGDRPAAQLTEPVAEPNDKLVRAIRALDPNNDKHWTASGLPAMSAVEQRYGATDITRRDVEAAAPGFNREAARNQE